MKRAIGSIALLCSIVLIYIGWFDVEVPRTEAGLNNDLDHHALAYEVVDGTPIILATFGGTVFLDTLRLERISMDIPPLPRWQWTGNWRVVSNPNAPATADLSSDFGPTVLFGVVNDDSIVAIRIERNGEVVQEAAVQGPAYIVHANDVLLTDTVVFLDAEGNIITSDDLM